MRSTGERLQSVVMAGRQGSAAARYRERLLQLRTAIQKQVGSSSFAIGFCACSHGAGTSMLAAGFVDALSETVKSRVGLVDANLHTPMASGFATYPGLAQYLSGEANFSEILQIRQGSSLTFVAAGKRGAEGETSALLSDRLSDAIDDFRSRFDVLVFDLPPIGVYADTAVMSPHLDGLVVVLEAEKDRWEAAERGKQIIEASGGRIVGAILNKKRYYVPEWLYRAL